MDNRLKYIGEHLEEMLIGPDEKFRFHCTQCGKCCINREDILLNPKDLYNIAATLSISQEEAVERYCETYMGGTSRLPIVRLRPQGSIKRCPLLKDRKCMVHKAKPTVCAMYPLGRCLAISQDTMSRIETAELKPQFILNEVDCGDNAEEHTVREWLESFGIPVEDQYYIRWQRVAMLASKIIKGVEGSWTTHGLNMLLTLIYNVLYLGYDMDKEFEPQFEERAEELRTILVKIESGMGGAENAG
mgnify:FL=1